MDPIVINERQHIQDQEINHITEFVNLINNSVSDFLQLTGYQLSMREIYDMIHKNGEAHTEALLVNVAKCMDYQLDKMKVTAHMMRNNLKNGLPESVSSLMSDLKSLKEHAGLKYIQKLILKNGAVIQTEDAENEIQDGLKIKIHSNTALELYNLNKEMADKLQYLTCFINEKTRLYFYDVTKLLPAFFKADPDSRKIEIKDDIDYEALIKNN